MKIMYKSIVILITLIIASSCVKEEMIVADPSFVLSFQRDGKTDALAGTPFYVIPSGSGEFFTLFDGTQGHVWGEEGAKGIDFNKADSLGVRYYIAGKYKLTLVASSSGNFGKNLSRIFKTVEINVIDKRNSFTLFNINGTDGVILPNDSILFSVPDIVIDFNFTAFFGLESDSSKVYVNNIEQTSGVTMNDFAQPVVYTVKSPQGDVKNYTVKFTTFPASGEKVLTKFALGSGGNGEIGVIDEINKIVNLTINYATVSTSANKVKLILTSSNSSTIYLNDVEFDNPDAKYTLTTLKKIKIVAQNKTEVEYAINMVLENPVTKFTFAGLIPAPEGIIDVVAKTITVNVLKGTDIAKLVAKWTGTIGKVTVGNTDQVNGVTLNNFTAPVAYTFYKGTGNTAKAGDIYNVIVNVIQ